MIFFIIKKEKGNPINIYKKIKLYSKISSMRLFDKKYYLNKYFDVKNSNIDPLNHYIYYGWKEKRTPSKNFDGNYYLKKYPDVKKSGQNPLIHYALFGKKEGRFPTKEKEHNSLKNRLNRLNKTILKQNTKIKENKNNIKNINEKLEKEKLEKNSIKNELKNIKNKLNIVEKNLNKYTQIYKIKHINKEEISSYMENFKEYGITKEKRSTKVIVSLTSFPERMYDIHYCLYSLLTQNFKPDEIVLWLAKEEFPNLEENIPKKVIDLKQHGLSIKWADKDYKSYNKLIDSLIKYPDDIIVTADDDVFYPPDWLEGLYTNFDGENIICHRCHFINFTNNKFEPYNKWKKCIKNDETSFLNFSTGVGGILYPPKSLYKEVLKEELFLDLAPTGDDIWFWSMAVLNNKKIKIVENGYNDIIYINPKRELGIGKETTLYNENKKGKNDEQFKKVLEYYPQLKDKLNEEYCPKVSIIIPIYNTEKYLEKCLDSIINQTLKNIEVICINDGSTDNSLEILEKYDNDKRIKNINQKNQGLGAARNKGLKIARGEYIGFIDSDDWVSEDYYEILYKNAKKFKADISATSQVIFPETNKRKSIGFSGKSILKSIGSKSKVIIESGVIWNKIYKREFIIKNEIYFSERRSIGEDNIFNILAIILSNKIITSDKVTYFWRQVETSITHMKRTKIDIKLLDNYKDILNRLSILKMSKEEKNSWEKAIYKRTQLDLYYLYRDSDEELRKKVIKNINQKFPELKMDLYL